MTAQTLPPEGALPKADLSLGEKIAFFRKREGFTQQEIADELDVSRSLVGQIEKNLTKPNLEFLSGFVKKIAINYEYLLDAQSISLNQSNQNMKIKQVVEMPIEIFQSIQQNLELILKTVQNLKPIDFQQSEYITPLEWMELCKVSRWKFDQLRHSGKLRVKLIGRKYFLHRSEVQRFFNNEL